MARLGNLSDEAEGDDEIVLWIGKTDGGASAAMAESFSGGAGAKAVGDGRGAVLVAIQNEAKAKIHDVMKGQV